MDDAAATLGGEVEVAPKKATVSLRRKEAVRVAHARNETGSIWG